MSVALIIGCLAPTSAPTPTPTLTPTLDLEAKIKNLESKIELLETKNKNLESKIEQLNRDNQNLQKKIAEINPYTDQPLIPAKPFKIFIKPTLGQVALTYEIGMDPGRRFESTTRDTVPDSGTLRIVVAGGTVEVTYRIFRENNTIALPTEIRNYYSLRLCDQNRVAMMMNGFPDIVREYEIQLARWDSVEGVYKW
jgi:outer membrane murein-binding lipoprotein Lpp